MINPAHIFLCGFMGCGKSTHGKRLAGLLKQPFYDLDDYIQKTENKSIQFIFENEGEGTFREMESTYLKKILSQDPCSVIALGGGTVCFNDNLSLIKRNGTLVYISMTADDLAERLKKSRQKRPLLKNVTTEKLPGFIEEKLKERSFYYEQAHIIVNGTNLSASDLKKAIERYQEI